MESIKFSVIVPVYKVEPYIRECIESVLHQTYQNYEILLVDDGSPDNSGLICDEYAAHNPDFTVIHQKNGGQLAARLAGLKIASGTYISFIDSDDYVDPSLLEEVLDIIKAYGADVIAYRLERVEMNGAPCDNTSVGLFPEGPVSRDDFLRRIIKSSEMNSLCLKIVRRRLFDLDYDYTKFFSIRYGEDMIMSLQSMQRAESFYYLNKVFYKYRSNTSSVSRNYSPNLPESFLLTSTYLHDYTEKSGFNSKEDSAAFCNRYLNQVWSILGSFYSDSNKNRNTDDLDAITDADYAQMLRDHIGSSDLSLYKKIILKFFFKKHYKVTGTAFRLYNRINRKK